MQLRPKNFHGDSIIYTSLMKVKLLEMCLLCLLVPKVVAINHLSTMSIDRISRVVTKPFDINQKKAVF